MTKLTKIKLVTDRVDIEPFKDISYVAEWENGKLVSLETDDIDMQNWGITKGLA